MEAFHKNIEGIRKVMSEMRAEKYAIVNPDTVALDEYHKTLYLKVLCSLIQFHNEPTEMQLLFLKRIVNGIGVEEKAEEYMRRALEISEEDMREFLSVMGKEKTKYYFVLEGILLVSLGQEDEESYQYLAEVIELLDINKNDLTYVGLVASAVLQQQSSFYDEAREKWHNERVAMVDYAPYLKDFYYGAIINNREVVHYVSPDRKYSSKITFKSLYKEKRVILENLDINITSEWRFDACEEVILKNLHISVKEVLAFRYCRGVTLYHCDVSGDNPITFTECQSVHLSKCCFHDFQGHVLSQHENKGMLIEECEFVDCSYKDTGCRKGQELGGMIYTDSKYRNAVNIIRKSSFRNFAMINCVDSSSYNRERLLF